MHENYKPLNQQQFKDGDLSIVPIRMEDRYSILKWRNEQLFHLRQNKPLSKHDQNHYFKTVVAGLFEDEQPGQLLFSYLKNGKCIGYGGLVHINWRDKNAEVSFITYTDIAENDYELYMSVFLDLLAQVASKELRFHKIFAYTFDVRPQIYPILEANGFVKEAILKEHCSFNGDFRDVIIHSKFI